MLTKYLLSQLLILCQPTVVQAEPIAVKPLDPILEGTQVVGYTSTDPVTEFVVPESWTLKKGGAIKRRLGDEQLELILQVAPSYPFSDQRASNLARQGVFKVSLPLPLNLKDANLYVPDVLGDLKAEFVPYEGNFQSEFYFRLALDLNQLNSLFKLSLTGQTLLGDVQFSTNVQGNEQETSVPIKIILPPHFLNPNYAKGRRMVRWLPSDDGRGGGISANGICDGEERCIYQDLRTGRFWRHSRKSGFPETPMKERLQGMGRL